MLSMGKILPGLACHEPLSCLPACTTVQYSWAKDTFCCMYIQYSKQKNSRMLGNSLRQRLTKPWTLWSWLIMQIATPGELGQAFVLSFTDFSFIPTQELHHICVRLLGSAVLNLCNSPTCIFRFNPNSFKWRDIFNSELIKVNQFKIEVTASKLSLVPIFK